MQKKTYIKILAVLLIFGVAGRFVPTKIEIPDAKEVGEVHTKEYWSNKLSLLRMIARSGAFKNRERYEIIEFDWEKPVVYGDTVLLFARYIDNTTGNGVALKGIFDIKSKELLKTETIGQ